MFQKEKISSHNLIQFQNELLLFTRFIFNHHSRICTFHRQDKNEFIIKLIIKNKESTRNEQK